MKIGLITHHWVPNFGANLQALSSVKYLESLGHSVIVIDYQPTDLVNQSSKQIDVQQLEVHQNFMNTHFDLTKKIESIENIADKLIGYEFDLILSGSDALFRLDLEKGREDLSFPNPFWLNWTFSEGFENTRKGFISVSNMGSDYKTLPDNTRNGIGELLRKFDFVSVRDSWTKRSLLDIDSEINVVETIDPVFLLSELKEAISIKSTLPINDKYIVLSPYKGMLSEDWLLKFRKIAHQNDYSVVGLRHPEGNFIDSSLVDYLVEDPLDPLQWYQIISNSAGYIGVRFHPIIVCLSNQVPFISLDTYQKSIFNPALSKTFDVCSKFDQQKYCLGKIGRKIRGPGWFFKQLQNQLSNRGDFPTAKLRLAQEELMNTYQKYTN